MKDKLTLWKKIKEHDDWLSSKRRHFVQRQKCDTVGDFGQAWGDGSHMERRSNSQKKLNE